MANRLKQEKSPYLLQHANNPVNWYPWGDEAFTKAKTEDKPIFLSVGYSTCHWCHVMERESFEDPEVAELLNKYYVSVKVDREERPDVDHIYMTICQAMTDSGGWPLTVVMTPEKKPFFAGTYFPKESKWGRPGLMDILGQISSAWQQKRGELIEAGEQVVEAIKPRISSSRGELSGETLEKAYRLFSRQFDPEFGGFGPAPKFPTPHNLTFLLRHWKRTGEKKALEMVEKTLQSMYRGGIYDHVGFGFSRYSTDREWLVPHFEKMLYDNALLAMAYLEAYQATGNEFYAGVAREIFTYVLRDMTSPEGGFYSAEDADSEGEEGKFYVWKPDEVIDVLGREDGELYCRLYNITPGGNFEGRSIPNLIYNSLEKQAVEMNISEEELRERIEASRKKMFLRREKRVHPYKDDKVLTAWNGLMIAALARGAAVLREMDYREAAEKALEFIWTRLRREDGRLLARFREDEALYLAYLDDYAFLAWGAIELYEATFKPEYLRRALQLTRQMDELFRDEQNGGYFFYAKDAEELIARPKEVYDGAMPSGNSVAALNLFRLSRLTGDPELESLARRQMDAFAGDVASYPRGFTHFLMALQFALGPTKEIVIAGKPDSDGLREMALALHSRFLPDSVLVLRPENSEAREIEELVPYVREQRSLDGKATAYVCENFTCMAPTTDLNRLVEAISH